jgi:hypothetical protein
MTTATTAALASAANEGEMFTLLFCALHEKRKGGSQAALSSVAPVFPACVVI